MWIRCEFCHRTVLKWFYRWHWRKHARPLRDGQQTDHITMPPEARYEGSLDGVPRVFFHAMCGRATGMPEKIIRSYLANPFLYNEYTFCSGCGDYVHQQELVWTETGERMIDYNDRLKRDYIRRHGRPPSQI